MNAVLIWPVFASVARALSSNSLVVGERAEGSLESPLAHASRLDRHGTVSAPLEPGAQFFDATRRAIPTMTHGGLIGYAGAFAAHEKPDAVRKVPSIKNTGRAITFAAQEHEVAPPIVCRSPVAADNLLYSAQATQHRSYIERKSCGAQVCICPRLSPAR